MLPLDHLPQTIKDVLLSQGVHENDLVAALRLDLDAEGNFGETWLILGRSARMLYRVVADDRDYKVDRYDLTMMTEPYIDNFTTTTRLLVHRYPVGYDALPQRDDYDTEDDYKRAMHAYHSAGETVILGHTTNACKRKLLAFLNIWERLYSGREVEETDAIFEQFNAKCPKCGTVYPDQERRICEHCGNRRGTLVRMLKYFSDFKPQLIVVVLCLILSAGISLVTPIVSGGLLLDQVISEPTYLVTDEEGNPSHLTVEQMEKLGLSPDRYEQVTGRYHEEKYVYVFVGILLGLAVLSLVISIVQNRNNAYMSTRVTKNMKNDIFRAMQRMSLSYFNKNNTGGLINRVNYDATRVRSFYIDGVPHLVVNVLKFVGVTVFLFIINWKLTLIVFIPVPIIVLMFKLMLPKLWRSFNRQWRRSHSLNVMLGDSLGGVRVVKAFAKEAEETHRFYEHSTRLYEANLKSNLISLSIFPVISLLIGMSSQAIWGFGGLEVMGARMTFGELQTYLGYIGMIFAPLNFFTTFTNILTDTMNSASRMFETLDQVPDIVDAPDAVELPVLKGNIRFDHVCFHYNPNRPILKDVSFEIREGDHVGIVGHTGSGKSTVANLITRMYDVISGSVEIDGYNVKQLKTASLRRGIATVSQEIFLFRGTIADNIRYARPDATPDEVIEAARAANAHDFIMNLPEGYETMVGIGSRSLSGGERQRISIARALLLDPSVLILDEATAAMDTETERQISDAIDQLIVGRTTISIAHRLSTLKNCNYLMAIENGEVAEIGTAEELMEKKGCYYKLYTLQNEQMQKVMQGF